jgi:DNA (cytosine-5)-methyltransferase 1
LDELGYDVQWQVLNSKDFGVPQNRERIYIVGHLRGTSRPEVFPVGGFNPASLEYVGGILSEKAKMWLDNGKTHSRNFPQGSRVYSDKGISATLASQAGGLGAKTGLYAVTVGYEDKERKIGLKEVQEANTITATSYKGVNASSRNVVIPVLTPDRIEKRQNGRRFKEDGEPSFTLTAQDKHGILLANKSKSQRNRVYNPEGVGPTLIGNAQGGGRAPIITRTVRAGGRGSTDEKHRWDVINDGVQIRRLTPVECERLQGFPDGWTAFGADAEPISDTQRYKMMGNAVTTNVVAAIINKLI